ESCNPLYVFFFFFQAEDGIRDGHVTGVQTCALPIFWKTHLPGANLFSLFMPNAMHAAWGPQITQWFYARGMNPQEEAASLGWVRSEERRVGKECRCRWWAYDEKKIVRELMRVERRKV